MYVIKKYLFRFIRHTESIRNGTFVFGPTFILFTLLSFKNAGWSGRDDQYVCVCRLASTLWNFENGLLSYYNQLSQSDHFS